MPRVSQKQVLLNREAIKVNAGRLFRERGFDGVGIHEIASAAGLTQGSFYGHFDSKEELAVEASEAVFRFGFERWEEELAGEDSFAAARLKFIGRYLSVENRDNPGESGPIATLVGDVARMPLDAPVRKIFTDGIRNVLGTLWPLAKNDAENELREQKALADLSAMVGAMLLSRATAGTDLSEKFLTGVSASLAARYRVDGGGQ
ncbi:TetR family transcriptional regulator [Xylophilus sp. Kf1]|nr:TetR family transcriptional regulator [Xylophilus sp. Kf1]